MKHRPRFLWFLVGGGLLLVAVATFVVGLTLTLKASSGTDATFRTDDGWVPVSVPAGEERMLYFPVSSDGAACDVREGTEPVPVDVPSARITVTTEGEEWRGLGSFVSDTGEVSIRCQSAGDDLEIRVGDPLGAGFVIGLLITILAPIVIGLAGFVVLLVTGILYATRPPRQT